MTDRDHGDILVRQRQRCSGAFLVKANAGSLADPDYRPYSDDDVFDPSWVRRELVTDAPVLAGPVYRLRGRTGGGIVQMKSFLARRTRIEAELRQAQRPELEARVIRKVRPDGAWFLGANRDWVDFVSRENRVFCGLGAVECICRTNYCPLGF
ncbi:MAG: hypothetical protein E5W19_02500 [Mesorhizobium sp.]|nr:MAG: hypothetical protein E5W19_02500 [Mesorhizobium sp.]